MAITLTPKQEELVEQMMKKERFVPREKLLDAALAAYLNQVEEDRRIMTREEIDQLLKGSKLQFGAMEETIEIYGDIVNFHHHPNGVVSPTKGE